MSKINDFLAGRGVEPSPFMQTLLDDSNSQEALVTLQAMPDDYVPEWSEIDTKPTTLAGFGITDGQVADATLDAIAAVVTAADKMIYFTAVDVATSTTLSAFGRSLIDDADATAARTTLGAQATITGAATTVATANLAVSRAVVSDASGKLAAHATTTAAEIGHLTGVTSAIQTQLNAKQATLGFVPEDSTKKNVAGGYAGLDGTGKISSSQLPAIAITDTFVVANQTEMLALTAEVGDVAVRTDVNRSFILRVAGAAVLANWQEMLAPTDLVSSVNGMTGAVTISTITGNAGSATVLANARTITLSGDTTGSIAFDGSTNVTLATTLANSGATAGTYPKVTVDVKGRVTGGTTLVAADIPALDWAKITTGKPTTLVGYGITDAAPSSHVGAGGTAHAVATTTVDGFLSAADKVKLNGLANYTHPTSGVGAGTYTMVTVNTLGHVTAGSSPTTLGGYGITDAQPLDATLTAMAGVATAADKIIYFTALDTATAATLSPFARTLIDDVDAPTARTTLGAQATITGAATTVATANLTVSKALVSDASGKIAAAATSATELGYVAGVTGAIQTQLDGKQAALGFVPEDASKKNQAGGYAGLDGTGKLDPAQLPAIAISDTFVVATEVAMLALTAEVGDIAVRTDLNQSFILKTAGASTLANWQALLTPTDLVSSVNGQTGAVTITTITGNAGSATVLATGRTIAATGDATGTSATFNGSANVSIPLVLANSGITAGTYTKVTVDAKGRATVGATLAATDIPALDWSKITTGKPTTLAGYGISDAIAVGGNAGSADKLSTARTIALSGDVTGSIAFDGSANVTIATTAKNSGVVAGTYTSVTVNAKGDVTAGTNPTTLAGYGILDATPSTHIGTGGSTHAAATTTVAGFMSAADKVKLGTIADGANLYVHPTSGVVAGTYTSMTVDGNGHITAATNPTTLAGYGITDALGISANAVSASKLLTARNIALTGDVTGTIAFDGSANVSIATTYKNSGVTAGTYKSVTVDAKGNITAGTNPTTLVGYGITDAQPTITGAATTVATANLTASKAVVSDASGKIVASAATAAEVGYLAGVTSGIQAQLTGKQAALGFTPEDSAKKNVAGGYAGLDAQGKLAISQIPAIAISDTFVVADEVAMLALTAEVGDIAVRTDLNRSFILKTAGASVLANWQELLTPSDQVSSVNGQTGVVNITTITGNAGTATTLATSRTIALSGDATGSIGFNGSANVTIPVVLANVVTGATYPKITYNAKGLVTGGAALAAADIPVLDWTKITTGKPTTLAGYGITDAAPSTHVGQGAGAHAAVTTSVNGFMIAADKVKLDGIATGANNYVHPVSAVTAGTYTSMTVDGNGHITAGTNPTTLAGYGITDAMPAGYTPAWSDLTGKPTTLAGYGITDAQAKDNTLTAMAGVTTAADKIIYFTGIDVATSATLTPFARTILDDADGTAVLTTIGGQAAITGAATTITGSNLALSKALVSDASGKVAVHASTTSVEIGYLAGVTSGIQGQLSGKQASLGFTPENSANKNQNNGYAGLDASGKISAAQIPAIAVTDTFVVADQTAMLALTAEVGDIAVRTDVSRSFILKTAGASTLANWQELLTPTDLVSSVNGMTGAVSITTITGNAGTATTLQTARNIALSGDATGTVSFNGSANVTIATTLANSGVTAGTYPKVTVDAKGRVTAGAAMVAADIPALDWSKITTGTPTTLAGYGITDALGLTATAAAATKLITPRAINGTNFDGTAAITTANWGTARTLTVGATGKSVNGSANIAWTLAEIGAMAAATASGINVAGSNTAPGTNGDLRYNPTSAEFEGYTAAQWKPIGGGGAVVWGAMSVNTTAEMGKGYMATAAGLTLTLPAAPIPGRTVGIGDYNGLNHTVTVARNGNKIMGIDEDFTFDVKNANMVFAYIDATVGWVLTSGFGESTSPMAIANKLRETNVAGKKVFSIPHEGMVDVWVDGKKQDPVIDFSADAQADTVTLTVGLASAATIIEIYSWNQALVLSADGIAYNNSVSGLAASTMQQAIDILASAGVSRNKVMNGKMEVSQRGTSFAAVATGTTTLDRWRWVNTSAGAVTISQQADAPAGFTKSLRVAVTTADASIAAGDYAYVEHNIEGSHIADLVAQTFCVSFRVRSAKVGKHCVALRNGATDRTYVAEYTVNVANTWETKTIVVQGGLPGTGTWDYVAGTGLRLEFVLMCGTTLRTTAGSWISGAGVATANQVNCLDVVGNIFGITGVQLESGIASTGFEQRPLPTELLLCQRYYQANKLLMSGNATNNYIGGSWILPTPMRASPTVTLASEGTANRVKIALTPTYSTLNSGGLSCDGSVLTMDALLATAPSSWAAFDYTLSADLT